jgi:hypothetical protein
MAFAIRSRTRQPVTVGPAVTTGPETTAQPSSGTSRVPASSGTSGRSGRIGAALGTAGAAAGSGVLMVARLVRLAAGLVVLLIALAIVFRLIGANPSNSIAHDVHTAASTIVGPFRGLFVFRHAKLEMTVNWGLAALVYLILGAALAALIARAAHPRSGVAHPEPADS